MSWVLGCQRNFLQDEVSNVESPRLNHRIMLPSHEIFVPCRSFLYICPYLVYEIEVQTELFLVILVLIHRHPMVGHVYLCRYNCLAPIGQLERGFPRGGSDSRSVRP